MSGTEGEMHPINYVDIKLHGISGLPPSFTAESGYPPMFADHPFRYEVDFSIGATKVTLGNGRLLTGISMYQQFVANAVLPAVDIGPKDSTRGDVPSEVRPPMGGHTSATPGEEEVRTTEGSGEGEGAGSHPAQIMWVLTPESDAVEYKDAEGQKKDTKPPPKGKAPAAAAPLAHETSKPIQPNYSAPPPCVARILLPPSLVQELESKVEQSLPLTLSFRRILRLHAPADWEDAMESRYQATIPVSLSALKEPGSTTLSATVVLQPNQVEAPKDEDKGKKKAAPKKAKGGAPAILSDELDPNEPHPYIVNQTSATLSLTFHSALTRLPQARPRPDLQPMDLIPTRLRPPRRPLDATKTFAAEVESLTQRIVKEYREHTDTSGLSGEEARTSFLNYLQSSGQSHAYKQVLIPAVQAIVKEKFIRQPNPPKEELNRVTNELYTYLTDTMHSTIHRLFHAMDQERATRGPLDGLSASERWKRRAMEAEVMKEYGMAAKFHQERLGATKPEFVGEESLPNVWAQYAEFSLRVRDVLKAEQAFREALAIDYAHLPSLLGYGTLLLSCNRFKEAEVFLQSAVDLCPSTLTWGCVALLYDMLILSLTEGPSSAQKQQEYARESKYAITQATRSGEEKKDMTPSDAYEHVALHCITLFQEDLANMCLVKCRPSDSVEQLYAQLYYQTEQYDEAVSILDKLVKSDPQATTARMLYGDVLYAQGNHVEAEQQYSAALRLDQYCGSGPSYVRLGNMYVALGKYRDALAAFIAGAKIWPCGLTWLGVGIAYYRLEDLLRAEQALNESNILNNLNPKTWGFLSLLCLRQKREEEADQAFNQAVKLGLDDSYLITEVGVEQLRVGRARVAETCFRRAIAIVDDVNTHMQLGRALCTMKRFDEARDEFQLVASNSTSDAQRAKAEEQIQLIPANL